MTVKELIEILGACNDDATIVISDPRGLIFPKGEQIWSVSDGGEVIIDIRNEDAYND